jgi:hypothetical protein
LVDAIKDDSGLLLDLLRSTRDWLTTLPKESLQHHPIALAAYVDDPPEPEAALRVLQDIF